jgi:iron complex outermembrane receptor protein
LKKHKLILLSAICMGMFQGAAANPEEATSLDAQTSVPEAVPTDSVESAPAPRIIEEIVVTSRRREERVQSVPVAVTAMSGEALERNNVDDVAALASQVPSLLVVPGASANRSIPVFSIRGQSQQDFTVLSDPSVSVYFGDVVVSRQQGLNQAMFDLESVEVLKGPQGTLFGRNSTGGAINIRPRRPGNAFEGYVAAGVGSYGQQNVDVMLNQPLADWAQLRVAGKLSDSDGYIRDVVLDRMVNHDHNKAARVSLALQPLDGLETVFSFSRYIEDSGGTGIFIDYISPTATTLLNQNAVALGYVGALDPAQLLQDQKSRGIYDVASGADQYSRISTRDWSNDTRYEINDWLSVRNIVGQRRVRGDSSDDSDGMPIPYLQIQRTYAFDQFSNELQLLGNHGSLDWIFGLYYFEEKGRTQDYSITAVAANAPLATQRPQPAASAFPAWGVTWVEGENVSQAAFFQATQRLDSVIDGLSVTAGGRITRDEREATIKSRTPTVCRITVDEDNDPATPNTTPAVADCAVTSDKAFSEPTYNLSLEYAFEPGKLVYLATRRGYRSGGFVRASTQQALEKPYDAERVTDYEFGLKADWQLAGMPLRTNLAVFSADYENVQRLELDTALTPPQTLTRNAAKARVRGGEFEFNLLPLDGLELSGFYSYVDPKFIEYVSMTGQDLSGSPFARAPKNIYSLTARYTLPVPAELGELSMMANWYKSDGYEPSDSYDPVLSIQGHQLLNLRADWASVLRSSFDVAIFVRNALDEEYLMANFTAPTSSLGFSSRSAGEPRIVGLELKYRFGALGGG